MKQPSALLPTLGGQPVRLTATLDGAMDAIAPQRLLALWPGRLIPNTRSWLSENLIDGRIENVDLALRLAPGAPPRAVLR